MSNIALFLAETYQGSYVPVVAELFRIDEVEDCMLQPLAFSMPFVDLDQAREFLRTIPTDMLMVSVGKALIYDNPIKINPFGFKWLSEVERVQ